MADISPQALSHILWIGGAPDAGKSTVAKLIATRFNLQIYHYDQHDVRQTKHLAQSSSYYRRVLQATEEERWILPTPKEMLQRSLRAFQDRLPLVLADLLALPKDPIIVAEGFGLTPELIFPLLSNQHQALWLIPTRDFKWNSMQLRGKHLRRLKMSEPQKAINNLIARDLFLAQEVQSQAQERGLVVSVVDGSQTAEELTDLVTQHFRVVLTRFDRQRGPNS
jgi:hypothetical protein